MQYRNPLEQSLSEAIKSQKIETANKLIDVFLISNESEADLACFNYHKQSFLFLALEAEIEPIASRLLDLQQDSVIIFAKDIKKRTLFHLAAMHGYVAIFNKLLQICSTQSNSYAKLWMDKDAHGNTPLHYAVLKGKIEIVKILVELIAKEKKPRNILNQTNKEGKAPLHQAFNLFSEEIIKLLIEYGADMYVQDNEKTAPFHLFCKTDSPTQLLFFHSLEKKVQTAILQSLRKTLIQDSNQNEIKQTYFKFQGLNSLQDLLLAHLEFNEAIPLRDSYTAVNGEALNDQNATYEEKYPINFISEEMLNRMPVYLNKLKQNALVKNLKLEESKEETIPTEKKLSVPDYQLLNQDRLLLNEIINQIENYLLNLKARQQVPTINKVVAVGLPLLCFIVLLGILAPLIILSLTAKEKYDECLSENSDNKMVCEGEKNTKELFIIIATLIAIFGCFGGVCFGGCATYNYFWKKEPDIAKREHKELLDDLQDLLTTLQQYEKKKQEEKNQDETSNLLNLSHIINNLETSMQKLNAKKSLPIYTLIQEYKELKTILITLRKWLNNSQEALSLFFKRRNKTVEFSGSFKSLLPKTTLSVNEGTPLILKK